MMATTMLNVLLMVETAVVIMSRLPTVQSVNVRKEPQLLPPLQLPPLQLPPLQQPHQLMDASSLNGKEMDGVMMATTMLNVLLMVETAVVIMSRLPTVQSVNVRKEPQLLLLPPLQLQQLMEHQEDARSLNGKEMDGVMMATTMLDVNGTEAIAAEMM